MNTLLIRVLNDILPPTEIPPTEVPAGWAWEKEPDEVDQDGTIWEGGWVLKKQDQLQTQKPGKGCVEEQREYISKNVDPKYYTCIHTTHTICTNSLCCDFFWHGENDANKECKYRGENKDLEGGLAQILGEDQ